MRNQAIDGGNCFDWGRASKEYAKFRDIYPDEFYRRIVDLGLCVKGQKVLDLGTGTGVLPRNLYRYGADFVGTDISENQIREAKRLSAEANMDIQFLVAAAENLHFAPDSFDVVTACQCFIYFDRDIVLPKVYSILKKSGRFCVMWVAWLPKEDAIAAASERLVLKYNPAWTGAGFARGGIMRPEWTDPLFRLNQTVAYDIPIAFTRESWHGRMLACRGIGASSLSEDEINAFTREHMEMLAAYPEQFDILHHVVIYDFVKTPG